MEDLKYALVTIMDEPFTIPGYVMIRSFLEHNQWFKGDIVILTYTKISENSAINILSLYPRIKFVNVDVSPYSNAIKKFENIRMMVPRDRYWPHMLKYEAFSMEEYDRVVFYDTDILFLGDVKNAFFNDYDYVICEDITTSRGEFKLGKKPMAWDKASYLNSGFISIKNPKKENRDALIKFAENYKINEDIFWYGQCVEQDTINGFLRDKNVVIYGPEYNALQCHYWEDCGKNLTNEKVLHFITQAKPWLIRKEEYDNGEFKNYKRIHSIWIKKWEEMNV